MFCPKCGNQLVDGAKFCAKCGNPIGTAPAPASGSPAPVNRPTTGPSFDIAKLFTDAPKELSVWTILGLAGGFLVFLSSFLPYMSLWGYSGGLFGSENFFLILSAIIFLLGGLFVMATAWIRVKKFTVISLMLSALMLLFTIIAMIIILANHLSLSVGFWFGLFGCIASGASAFLQIGNNETR